MKILQVSTPFLLVSPDLKYGGSERIVYLLDKELHKKAFSSGVVAPGNSKPYSNLYPTLPYDMGVDDVLDRNANKSFHGIYGRLAHVAHALNYINNIDCDVVHLHDDNILPYFNQIKKPAILTLHSDIDGFWDNKFVPFLKEVDYTLVAISKSQKKIYGDKGFRVRYVVYNGVEEENFFVSESVHLYLLSLGSIQHVKGQDKAIEVAKKSGLDLIIAGNIGDSKFFKEKIKPNITNDLTAEEDKFNAYLSIKDSQGQKIVYTGQVNDKQKIPLYSNATAFLMPIDWEEPFGLVMVESMMSGTPVIAFNRGSIPEVIDDGVTGVIVDNLEEMINAVKDITKFDRKKIREIATKKFGKKQMIENYIQVYREISNQKD